MYLFYCASFIIISLSILQIDQADKDFCKSFRIIDRQYRHLILIALTNTILHKGGM